MDKINISNIFPDTKIENSKPLDIYSLYHPENNKTKIDIERLINLRKERKKKTIEQYDKYFQSCINKIQMANTLGKLSLTYQVPKIVFMYPDYNPYECLEHINRKLEDLKLDTTVVPEFLTIYINWVNIGQKK